MFQFPLKWKFCVSQFYFMCDTYKTQFCFQTHFVLALWVQFIVLTVLRLYERFLGVFHIKSFLSQSSTISPKWTTEMFLSSTCTLRLMNWPRTFYLETRQNWLFERDLMTFTYRKRTFDEQPIERNNFSVFLYLSIISQSQIPFRRASEK